MEQRCDELNTCRHFVPEERWVDLKIQSDCMVFGKELTCRDLTVEGDFFLIGNLFCNDIDIKGNCIIYGNIYSCRKVKVQGDLCIYVTSESTNHIEGGFFGPYGDVETGGNLIVMYRIRAGVYKIKVGGDVITRDVECKAIFVAGDCIAYPGGIDADEPVYVLGDITTGWPVEAKEVYCGGKYHCLSADEKESAIIHENLQHWSN